MREGAERRLGAMVPTEESRRGGSGVYGAGAAPPTDVAIARLASRRQCLMGRSPKSCGTRHSTFITHCLCFRFGFDLDRLPDLIPSFRGERPRKRAHGDGSTCGRKRNHALVPALVARGRTLPGSASFAFRAACPHPAQVAAARVSPGSMPRPFTTFMSRPRSLAHFPHSSAPGRPVGIAGPRWPRRVFPRALVPRPFPSGDGEAETPARLPRSFTEPSAAHGWLR